MAEEFQLSFVHYPKNTYIVVEGKQNADCFFIIREGRVQLSKEVEIVSNEHINSLGPGGFFGVVSAMASHSHIESARAITDVTLIAVRRGQFSHLIQKNSPVAMKIIREFSRRMRFLDEALIRFTLKNSVTVDREHLFEVGKYYARQEQYGLACYAWRRYLKLCPGSGKRAAALEMLGKFSSHDTGPELEFTDEDTERVYPQDAMIFAEGEPGEEIYVIKKGSVKIVKVIASGEMLLAILKAGDIFGEMAVLESEPRAASAIAYSECQLTVINRANFENMILTHPHTITRLTSMLAERIWFIYKQLSNTLITDPLGRMYDYLLIQLERKRVDVNTTKSFTFDFGPGELIHMVGLSRKEGRQYIDKLLNNKYIQVLHEKIYVMEVSEITRQSTYFRKMQQLENVRKSSSNFAPF